MSGEIPSATPDNLSVRSTSGPIGPEKRVNHSLPYIDPCQPGNLFIYDVLLIQKVFVFLLWYFFAYGISFVATVPVRIVDPSKDLNSYGLGSVDWKERVESWKLKQEKNMPHLATRYTEGKGGGDMEGSGSNGEDFQM